MMASASPLALQSIYAGLLLTTVAASLAIHLGWQSRRMPGRPAVAVQACAAILFGGGVWAAQLVVASSGKTDPSLGWPSAAASWVAYTVAGAALMVVAARKALAPGARNTAALALWFCAGMLAARQLENGGALGWPRGAVDIVVAALISALTVGLLLRARRASPALAHALRTAAAAWLGCSLMGWQVLDAVASSSTPTVLPVWSPAATLALMVLVALLAATLLARLLDGMALARADGRLQASKEETARLRSANEILLRRAHLDALTGLPRRLVFDDRLRQALARLKRARQGSTPGTAGVLAVLCLDLDRLGAVNEVMGRAAGDQVLKEAARRIRAVTREGDTAARDEGDGFLVLMENLTTTSECTALAQRLTDSLSARYEVEGRMLEVPGSIGIAVYPDHGHDGELVSHAEMAMRAAKRCGGGAFMVFDPQEERDTREQQALQNDLRRAVELGQLALHYQPKVDAQRGVIRGVEALLRWAHPQRGMVSPAVFIPIAERTGLIHALGQWVIDEACRQMQAWNDAGIRLRVAVNVSAHQLRRDDFVPSIGQALDRYQIEASQLLCEVTESTAMEDTERTRQVFENLGRLGVYLSIDDFGTGYSSLSYLRQLPAKQLKIDRSFVKDLEASVDARAVVDSVVRLAHALGLRVVAEGVETAGQRDILLALNCDELQGYFYAKPMPAASVMAWAYGKKPQGGVDFSPSVVDEPDTGSE